MAKKPKLIDWQVHVRLSGVGRLAKELGVSRFYLREVLRGQRKGGKKLWEKMAAMGITPRSESWQ